VDACPVGRSAGHAARAGGCSDPVCNSVGEAPRGDRGGRERVGRLGAGAAERVRFTRSDTGTGPCLPPCGPDGTERRIGRPQNPTEQTRYYRGKKTCHTVNNVLLINAVLTILCLRETDEGRPHDTRMAEATPSPLPAGSRRLQDLGFLAFTLDRVELSMPTRKPRGRALTRRPKTAHRRLARRRVGIEHVNSRVKRCRIVHDTCRLRQAGVRDLIMEVGCARHNFRVRLTPWQPMG
jgi:DDE superfamily endonuclease